MDPSSDFGFIHKATIYTASDRLASSEIVANQKSRSKLLTQKRIVLPIFRRTKRRSSDKEAAVSMFWIGRWSLATMLLLNPLRTPD